MNGGAATLPPATAIGMLEAQHLQRAYGKRQVVRDVSQIGRAHV